MNANDIATDSEGNGFSLINSAGDFAGLATWEQLRESLNASPEGWISHSSGLDVYVEGIAEGAGWRWLPEHVTKRPHRSLKTIQGSGAERDAEVANTYSAKPIDAPMVVILDDFVTRGSTIGDVARAIRLTSPRAEVCGLALAKTDRVAYWAGTTAPISNSHLDDSWRKLWDGET